MKKSLLLIILCSLSLSALDSAKIYKQCAMCHGKHGEKVAMNSSPKLKELSEEKLTTSLKMMIDGTSTIPSKYLGMHQKKLKKVSADNLAEMVTYILELK